MNTEWRRMKDVSVSVSELAYQTGISYESLSEVITYLSLEKGLGYKMAFGKVITYLSLEKSLGYKMAFGEVLELLRSRKENYDGKFEKDI